MKHWQQYLAELIGTFFLVFFGCGAMILSELGHGTIAPSIPIVFGGAVSIMIYATGHISGAHFNPAVTLSFFLCKKFPKEKILGYLSAQIVGATLASFIHFLIWGANHQFGGTQLGVSVGTGFLVEFILSFVLMFVIMSVATDSRAVGELAGIAIGTTVALCAFVGGPLTNASMNPARSIGPAILSGSIDNLWLYILAPILGAALGALTYDKIRCLNEPDEDSHGCC